MHDEGIDIIETSAAEVINQEAALSLITKAEIDVQISTAKAFPRSIAQFLKRAESMATVSESVAQSCAYALPRGGKTLKGPSVRLAEIVVSSYQNIRTGARVIANDGRQITAQGICHDLETNTCVTVEVKRSILQNEWVAGRKTGRMVPMTEDMQVVTGNAACAIAFRNAVFKVIPAALIQDVFEKVEQVARGTAETLVARRTKALDYLHGLKVTDAQICEVLELRSVEDIDLEKLVVLRGMVTLIKNEESTVAELFHQDKTPKDKAEKATDATTDAIKTAASRATKVNPK
jgi:hypothetical protein